MKRREFTKLAGLSVIAISTTGFINFNGENYMGDCETTSDILGPFYRPDSPVRDNLVIQGQPGDIIELSGRVRQKDCATPHSKAKIELWHCSPDEIYDNDSDEFLYRGTTFADMQGKYKFTTQMPVPYPVGIGEIRPAHFHMMFSAPGYQSLITQIYFEGDPHIAKDPSASDPRASRRILKIKKEQNIHKIVFDCNMNDKLKISNTGMEKIIGRYRNLATGIITEFFSKDGDLWVRNEVFGKVFTFTGENSFEYGGLPEGMYEKLHFELQEGGVVKLTKTTSYGNGEEKINKFTRLN